MTKENARPTIGSESAHGQRNHTPTRRRQPAYSRALRDLLRSGHEPFHGIGVWLDSRPPARPILAPLAVFPDTAPESCDWSVCAGRDVIVPDAHRLDPHRLARLIDAVKAVRPRRLQVHRIVDGACQVEFVIVAEVA